MIQTLFFYMFSSVLVASAAMVITARNPVHAVLFLILAFFNAAGLFMMLGAEFVAMILVIVYVGAVAVLFLFVVMMLDVDFASLRTGAKKHAIVGAVVGGVLLVELLWLYTHSKNSNLLTHQPKHPIPDPAVLSNTQALGELLYTHYVYLFQVSGLILLVAMIGAITLTHRKRPSVRKQNIDEQLSRNPKDVIRIEKIETGAGVS